MGFSREPAEWVVSLWFPFRPTKQHTPKLSETAWALQLVESQNPHWIDERARIGGSLPWRVIQEPLLCLFGSFWFVLKTIQHEEHPFRRKTTWVVIGARNGPNIKISFGIYTVHQPLWEFQLLEFKSPHGCASFCLRLWVPRFPSQIDKTKGTPTIL